MTHEEMLAMAREVGCVEPEFGRVNTPRTKGKSWLMRDFYNKAYADGVTAERERCARVCEEISNNMYWLNNRKEIAEDCAAAIRKGE